MRGELTAAVRSLFTGLSLHPMGMDDTGAETGLSHWQVSRRGAGAAVERDGYSTRD